MEQVVVDAILKYHAYAGPWWMLNGLDCTYFSEDVGSKENRHAVRRLIDMYVRCAREKKQDDLSDLWHAEQINVIAHLAESFDVARAADEKMFDELKTRLDEAIRQRDQVSSDTKDVVLLGGYWRKLAAEQQLELRLDEIVRDVTKRCERAGCVWKFWCTEARKELIEFNETCARSRVEMFIENYKKVPGVEEENKLICAMMYSDNRIGFGKGTSDPKLVFWKYAELLRPHRDDKKLGPFRAGDRKWTKPEN